MAGQTGRASLRFCAAGLPLKCSAVQCSVLVQHVACHPPPGWMKTARFSHQRSCSTEWVLWNLNIMSLLSSSSSSSSDDYTTEQVLGTEIVEPGLGGTEGGFVKWFLKDTYVCPHVFNLVERGGRQDSRLRPELQRHWVTSSKGQLRSGKQSRWISTWGYRHWLTFPLLISGTGQLVKNTRNKSLKKRKLQHHE